jgi:hypothetical protein
MHVLDLAPSNYWKIAQSPCAINEISLLEESAVVVTMNQTTHLERTLDENSVNLMEGADGPRKEVRAYSGHGGQLIRG